MSRQDTSLTMAILRAWMWLTPMVMLVASVVFAVVAAADGRWGLVAVMVIAALLALGLLFAHWWLLYRFGKAVEK